MTEPGLSWLDDAPPHSDADAPHTEQPKAKANGHDKTASAEPPKNPIILRPIADIVAEKREPEWILRNILEQRVLAVMAGPRGSFKSFVALDWAMRAAVGYHGVVILSGEGGGLDRRVDAWMRTHEPALDLKTLHVVALERAVNLSALETCSLVVEAMKALPWTVDLIVVDTLSKYTPGMDENDNTENAEFLSLIGGLMRDGLKCSVLLVAHSGHSSDARPRGASALMCNPDCEYIVKRPDGGMVATVSRDRFKDTASLPALTYNAKVIDLGRVDSYGDVVTSLVLETTDTPPPAPARVAGKNQQAAIVALREFSRTHPDSNHITTTDLADMLKVVGIGRQRRPEIVNFLVKAGILTPSIGGHSLNPEALK